MSNSCILTKIGAERLDYWNFLSSEGIQEHCWGRTQLRFSGSYYFCFQAQWQFIRAIFRLLANLAKIPTRQ
jgi:hypothetical protein